MKTRNTKGHTFGKNLSPGRMGNCINYILTTTLKFCSTPERAVLIRSKSLVLTLNRTLRYPKDICLGKVKSGTELLFNYKNRVESEWQRVNPKLPRLPAAAV